MERISDSDINEVDGDSDNQNILSKITSQYPTYFHTNQETCFWCAYKISTFYFVILQIVGSLL